MEFKLDGIIAAYNAKSRSASCELTFWERQLADRMLDAIAQQPPRAIGSMTKTEAYYLNKWRLSEYSSLEH